MTSISQHGKLQWSIEVQLYEYLLSMVTLFYIFAVALLSIFFLILKSAAGNHSRLYYVPMEVLAVVPHQDVCTYYCS